MGKPKKLRKICKQAKMGKPHRMYELALRLESGRGVKQDMPLAMMWMNAAADAGYGPAIEWLNDYYFDDDAAVQAHS